MRNEDSISDLGWVSLFFVVCLCNAVVGWLAASPAGLPSRWLLGS